MELRSGHNCEGDYRAVLHSTVLASIAWDPGQLNPPGASSALGPTVEIHQRLARRPNPRCSAPHLSRHGRTAVYRLSWTKGPKKVGQSYKCQINKTWTAPEHKMCKGSGRSDGGFAIQSCAVEGQGKSRHTVYARPASWYVCFERLPKASCDLL